MAIVNFFGVASADTVARNGGGYDVSYPVPRGVEGADPTPVTGTRLVIVSTVEQGVNEDIQMPPASEPHEMTVINKTIGEIYLWPQAGDVFAGSGDRSMMTGGSSKTFMSEPVSRTWYVIG